jgi:hypothetical protein
MSWISLSLSLALILNAAAASSQQPNRSQGDALKLNTRGDDGPTIYFRRPRRVDLILSCLTRKVTTERNDRFLFSSSPFVTQIRFDFCFAS